MHSGKQDQVSDKITGFQDPGLVIVFVLPG